MGLSTPSGDPANPGMPVFPSYRFNLQFYREFINYIELDRLEYVPGSLTIPWNFSSTTIDNAQEFSGTIPPSALTQSQIPITDGSYKPIEINFTFPTATPFLFGAGGADPFSASQGLVDPAPASAVSEVGGPINIPEIHWRDDRVIGRILYHLTLTPPGDINPNYASVTQEYAEAAATDGEDFSWQGLWNYDQQQALAVGLSETAESVYVLPSFREVYPIIYNQIRYSASVLKLVPLNDLTPVMLSAIQTYMIAFDYQMQTYMQQLVQYYETEKGAVTVLAPDEPGGTTIHNIHQWILDATTANLQSHGSYLKIQYPRESPNNPNIFVEFESSGDYIPQQQLMEEITESMLEQEFETAANNIQNTYIQPFVNAFAPSWSALSTGELTPEQKALIESKHFPTVYGILVDNMFNYVITNGVFDAATLQSLTLFHLNENCPPSEVADLLDVQGIMKQLKDEYVEAMCNDRPEIPSRTIIRNVIKYGMHLELIQMQIAQIFIKNIFVMTAFKLDSLLTDGEADAMNQSGFIFKFLRKQITTSLLTFLRNSENMDESTVRRDLVSYFNIKINRESNVAQGGIKYSNGTIAFPTGVTFSVTDSGAFVGFDEIIDYLISERLYLGRESVAKAIRMSVPGNNPVSLDQAFLASIPTFTVTNEYPGVLVQKIQEYYGTDDTPRVFLTRKHYTLLGGVKKATIKMWYYYGGEAPAAINIFEFNGMIPSFDSEGTNSTMMEQVRKAVNSTSTWPPED